MTELRKKTLPIEALRRAVRYNPETGEMTWLPRSVDHFSGPRAERECKRWNAIYAYTPALACVGSDGYLRGHLFGQTFKAHRVAWAIQFGEWPDFVDHLNGDRADNRLCNLRNVTRSENAKNKARQSDGRAIAGLAKGRWKENWVAQIGVDGRSMHLGTFKCFGQAVIARKSAERMYGFTPGHGVR